MRQTLVGMQSFHPYQLLGWNFLACVDEDLQESIHQCKQGR